MTRTLLILLDQGYLVHEKNKHKWTPLDCAAASGAYECAVLLLKYGSPVDPRDRNSTTPLHLAAQHGHHRIVKLLLDSGADLSIQHDDGKTALELAICSKKRSAAKVILDNNNWKVALKHIYNEKNNDGENIPTTPLRMLIRTFPDLAQEVLDKCKDWKKELLEENQYEQEGYFANKPEDATQVEFDFQYLDDTFSIKENSGKFAYKEESEDDFNPYHQKKRVVLENHPLMIMVKEQRPQLLRHPVCLALMRYKWKTLGRPLFYFNLLLYTFFLTLLTIYTLGRLNYKSFPRPQRIELDNLGNQGMGLDNLGNQGMGLDNLGNQGLGLDNLGNQEMGLDMENLIVCKYLLLASVILLMLAEIGEMYRMHRSYFKWSNAVDWAIYVLALVFVFEFNFLKFFRFGPGCPDVEKCWMWPVGSVLMICVWLNLLKYFTQLPFFGIFLIMFGNIFKTMEKLSLLILIFVVAFGLGFHILFINNTAFDGIGFSLVKTFVMMIGEFDFENIITDHQDPSIPFNDDQNKEMARNFPFPILSTFVFILFIFIMAIIIMNLMVGLAVDDIKAIQECAVFQKLSLNAELILGLERFLPTLRILWSHKVSEYLFPGSRKGFREQKITMSKPTSKSFDITDNLEGDTIWKSLKRPQEEKASTLELSYELDRISKQLENMCRTTDDIRKALCKPDRSKSLSC